MKHYVLFQKYIYNTERTLRHVNFDVSYALLLLDLKKCSVKNIWFNKTVGFSRILVNLQRCVEVKSQSNGLVVGHFLLYLTSCNEVNAMNKYNTK